MKRAFVLPVSAAVLGAGLAVTVWAMDRPHEARHVIRIADEAELTVTAEEIGFKEELLQEILQEVSEEIRVAVESDQDLTPAEREQLRQALEQLNDRLPVQLDLSETMEILTSKDGQAHRDVVVEVREVAEVKELAEKGEAADAAARVDANTGGGN